MYPISCTKQQTKCAAVWLFHLVNLSKYISSRNKACYRPLSVLRTTGSNRGHGKYGPDFDKHKYEIVWSVLLHGGVQYIHWRAFTLVFVLSYNKNLSDSQPKDPNLETSEDEIWFKHRVEIQVNRLFLNEKKKQFGARRHLTSRGFTLHSSLSHSNKMSQHPILWTAERVRLLWKREGWCEHQLSSWLDWTLGQNVPIKWTANK